MSQPFEFKNPLDGAPPPLADQGKNPFSDGEPTQAEISDNIYATSNTDVADLQPQYVTTYTHRGPLLLRLAISNLAICVVSILALFLWDSNFLFILASNGLLGIALGIKAGYDLAAMRADAMAGGGRGKTLAALVLSLVTVLLTVVSIVVSMYVA